MTEYDYSPEAYERFMAKQNSVARWVDQQVNESYRYRNPFVPPSSASESYRSPHSSHSSPRSTSPNQNHRRLEYSDRDRGYESSRSRPPTRSHAVHDTGRSRHHHSHSAAVPAVYPIHHNRDAAYSTTSLDMYSQSHPNTRTSSRYPSRPSHSRTYSYAKNPAFSSSQLHLRSNGAHETVRMSDLTRAGYKTAPGQPVVMHAGRETYVVMPGGHRGVEFRSPERHSSPSKSAPVYTYATSPSKKQSLLRRLFQPSSRKTVEPVYVQAGPPTSGNRLRRRAASMH